ncbi:M24 family metallopeptidase [Granulicatella seriolae]|uniref:Xaa-Pro peptidase family protein n=1 Tax=Granulicatella seriolae TaxID=2967226 RepID=A0ABT1WMQ1_9LACT|nr:Xaa-Pro peptidase family protein [Granulicatella seriolae]
MNKIHVLQEAMKQEALDALLVYSPYNLRYISNFTGTTGYALITKNKAFFITDARYTQQAQQQAHDFQVIEQTSSWIDALADVVQNEGVKHIGFEAQHLTVAALEQLESYIDANFVATTGLVETLREVKSPEEIETIKQACAISDKAFLHILDFIKVGKSEIEIANELDFYMRQLGASGVSFETIVASGVRSSMPHGVASHKLIEEGDFITLDYGCYYQGYVSDMTRTIAVGNPIDQLKEIHAITLQAQLLVSQAAGPGVTGVELDAVARDYISKHGYGDKFVHSTGHGIGLEIHEAPNVSRLAKKAFVAGNVITNEPGIYLPGIGGVRIEDDLVITETGAEVLQTVSKELILL